MGFTGCGKTRRGTFPAYCNNSVQFAAGHYHVAKPKFPLLMARDVTRFQEITVY